ncbi:hypothetical protein [Burkholderia sp. SIMBA_062]|uniref:hypothetical protein n=1 Tax=Burkholderia sp. SIMBA_062 TaxID=3085803 RepID=UPI00397D9543
MQAGSVGKTGASALYGVGGDVNGMTVDTVRAYSGDSGQQFANRANWNLQLEAGLREQVFVGGLQDQFGQLASDALAASRAQGAALKQRLGSEFAGSANWALAQQRAEHAAAVARQAEATRSGLVGFDLGRGANDWSDDAAGFDLGRGGWGGESPLSRAGQWLDRPIQPLEHLADTVRRGNAMMAEGLDAVGLSGLAGAQRALGDMIPGAVPTRPWEIALSAAPLVVKAPGALRSAGEMFGPNLAQMAESYLGRTGGSSYVIEGPNVRSIGVANLTERGTLTNLRPTDSAVAQRPIRALVQDESGRYWLQGPGGNKITPSGSYDFVTMPDGSIRIARQNLNPDFSTYLGLSGGGEVDFAGSIRFANNTGPNRGSIVNWTNSSGHYQPPASMIGNAGLPVELFGQFNPFAPR